MFKVTLFKIVLFLIFILCKSDLLDIPLVGGKMGDILNRGILLSDFIIRII